MFLLGNLANDKVCVTAGVDCTNVDYTFIALTIQDGLTGADGLLGLSHTSADGPSFLQGLKNNGVI